MSKNPWSAYETKALVQMKTDGMAFIDICSELGREPVIVKRKLKHLGMLPRQRTNPTENAEIKRGICIIAENQKVTVSMVIAAIKLMDRKGEFE